MKVKIIGPKITATLLFEEAEMFALGLDIFGVKVIEADDPRGEMVFFAIILWDYKNRS